MKLILTEDDGTVLDTVEITDDEWKHAQSNVILAASLITYLQAGER